MDTIEKNLNPQTGTGKRKFTPHSNNYNETGYKGVFARKLSNGIDRYDAYVTIAQPSKKNISLYVGRFDTAPEAALARIKFIDLLK